MREMYARGGESHRSLAKKFKVSDTTVTRCLNGYHYSHLNGEIGSWRKGCFGSKCLTQTQIVEIQTSSESVPKLAKIHAVSCSTIQRIKKGGDAQ